MRTVNRLFLVLAVCVALSGCGTGGAADREEGAVLNRGSVIDEVLLESMDINSNVDRLEVARKARAKVLDDRHYLGFPELGGLPTPESCVAGMSVKQSVPYVYIYYIANGDANFDDTELYSSVLAWLSIVQDCGFRVETIESASYIYDGSSEMAHFVLSGTQEVGYLMYLQIVC